MDKSQRGLVKKAMRGNPKDFGTLIQEELATYTGVDVGNYGQGAVTATINGEAAAVEGVNPFYEREGQWVSTMTLAVPQSQQDAETLSLEVTLQDLEGRVENEEAQAAADQDQLARLEWEANEETAGTPYPEEPPVTVTSQAIPGSFSASFTLTVDREHSFSFAADAEDNGAKVLAVSGTPVQTVITVEKPFWGLLDSIVETEAPTQGVACLELPDGTQLWMDLDRSRDLGGYDYTLQESQQADLYFDGLPGGHHRPQRDGPVRGCRCQGPHLATARLALRCSTGGDRGPSGGIAQPPLPTWGPHQTVTS